MKTIIIAFFYVLLYLKPALAAEKIIELNSREFSQSDKLAKDFDEAKRKAEEEELKQRKIMASLYEINKETKRIVKNKSQLQSQKGSLQSSIQKLAQKTEELNQLSKTQKARLSERLRAIYQVGGQSIPRMIFASQSSAELERNLKILGIIAKRDIDLIREFTQTQNEIHAKKEKLVNRMAHLKKLDEKINNQEQKLAIEAQKKNSVLENIRKNKEFAYRKIDEIKEKTLLSHVEDSGIFDLLFKPSFAEQKGMLKLPIDGRVVRKFGIEKEPGQPYVIANKGIFIETDKNKNVSSVFSGVVSFVGELPHYGNTIIIDHGDHYYTVYSNNQSVKVRQGEEVRQGQMIAQSGSSQYEQMNGIYFEIRHFSEPYDPQKWMKGISL